MKVIAFRFIYENQSSDWMGIAIGRDWTSLFWYIDAFGDPYSCEYKLLPMGGAVCWHERWEGDGGPDILGYEVDEVETANLPISRENGWCPFPIDKVILS